MIEKKCHARFALSAVQKFKAIKELGNYVNVH